MIQFAIYLIFGILYSNYDFQNFCCGDIRDCFETLKVGDKYDLTDLVILSRRAIETYVISTRNIAKVLRVIHMYRLLEGFDNVCEDLLDRCRKFIGDNLRTAQDVFNLLAETCEDEDDLERGFETELLVKLLRDTAKCRNCKMHPTDCLNGQKVTYDNMITG